MRPSSTNPKTLLRVCAALAAFGVATVHAQGLPALPYVMGGDCPLECCRLGQWTTFAEIPVHAKPGDTRSRAGRIAANATFVADSSLVLVRQFGLAVVDRPVRALPGAVSDSTMLEAGDTVYLIHYQGEDFFNAMVNGARRDIQAFWKDGPGMLRPTNTESFCRALRGPSEEWWVRVRFGPDSGSVGWIDMSRNQAVSGPDGCGDGGG
jgi:hypothetical protein